MATVVAMMVAVMVWVEAAETVNVVAASTLLPVRYASTWMSSCVVRSLQPTRFKAIAAPRANAGVVPVPTPTVTAEASTTASIRDESVVETVTAPWLVPVPVAVRELPETQAFAAPRMVLSAVAPPPPTAGVALPEALTDTPTAEAAELAVMAAVSEEVTLTLPSVAVTGLASWMYDCMSLRISFRAMLSPTATESDLPVDTATDSVGADTVLVMVELSVDCTPTLPACASIPEEPLIPARTYVLTLFSETTAPTVTAVEALKLTSEALTEELAVEVMAASEEALTSTPPAAVTLLDWMSASTSSGCSLAMFVPNSASTVLKRKFCGLMPMVLKARVTPTADPSAVVLLATEASMTEVFSAVTDTFPPPVVVTPLSLTVAVAPLSTLLVAMIPLTAREEPPKTLPPSELTVLVSVAYMPAFSIAWTVKSPAAVTEALVMELAALPRASLCTTRPPIAVELESEKLIPRPARSLMMLVVVTGSHREVSA